MKTAVEWLVQRLAENGIIHSFDIEQAKAMEKEQIKDAFVECWKSNVPDGIECKLDAEQYYKETFIT
jgi:uncharacterized protein YdeI (YjbR/CyaY-like superfamily)